MKHAIKPGLVCAYRGRTDIALRGLYYQVLRVTPSEVLAWSNPRQAVGSKNEGMCWQGTPEQFEKEFLW